MDNKGLSVDGMDTMEISRILEPFIVEYFSGFKPESEESLFVEGHVFWLEEIDGIVPEHYLELFTGEDKFVCLSGFACTTNTHGKKEQRVISLVMDEHSKRAFLLCAHEDTNDGGEETYIIKDFLL